MGGRLEGMGGAGWAPFFLAVSSGSRFLVTVTTLRTRWFPPWRIMFTTCRWPTFTTFSLLTCGKTGCGEGAHVGGRDQHPPGAARAQLPTDERTGGWGVCRPLARSRGGQVGLPAHPGAQVLTAAGLGPSPWPPATWEKPDRRLPGSRGVALTPSIFTLKRKD